MFSLFGFGRENVGGGWWEGVKGDILGLFPADFVQVVDASEVMLSIQIRKVLGQVLLERKDSEDIGRKLLDVERELLERIFEGFSKDF